MAGVIDSLRAQRTGRICLSNFAEHSNGSNEARFREDFMKFFSFDILNITPESESRAVD